MRKTLNFLLFIACLNFLYAQEGIKVINIQNLDVNTEFADFGVSFYKGNQVLFTSSKKDRVVKRKDRSHNRMQYLKFYKGIVAEDGQIISEELFSKEKYNMFHESDITFSVDGKTIYFTLNNYIDDNYRKNFIQQKHKNHILNIFKATIDENGIATNIESLSFNSETYSVSNPELSPDGRTLYFSSDKDGGFGMNDIYKVTINEDGTYGEPKNLGAEINTKYNEFFPFLSTNNTFYFTSDGHGGKGFLDIYSSNYTDQVYATPTNLSDVNSKYDDFAFVINPEQNVGYFSSSRKGKGNADIYSFILKPLGCNQTIAGIVRNKNTNEIIANVQVKLSNNKNLNNTITTNENGEFNFDVDCETAYTLNTSKVDFKESGETIFTSSKVNSNNTDFTLYLEPIECKQTISGIVRNQDTNEILANVEVKLSRKSGFEKKLKTNESGEFKFDIDCETNYVINASKINFIDSKEITFNSTKENAENTDQIVYLKPIECKQTITGIVRNEETDYIIANAEVILSNDLGYKKKINTNNNGEFKFDIDCETTYQINASKTNFIDSEVTSFSSTEENAKNTDQIVYLKPIECKQTIAGIITNKETLVPIKNVTVSLFQDGIIVEKAITLVNGLFNFKSKADCKIAYKVVAEVKNYTSKTEEIKTSNIPNKGNYLEIKLQETNEFITYKNIKMIRTKPIYFDLNKDNIKREAAIELDKVVRIMKRYPTIKIELKAHTDSRAPDEYNMSLSKRRASSSVAYIVSQGIDSNRISGEGYGETRLLNKCSNNVKCSESEHQENRRTEFIVINN